MKIILVLPEDNLGGGIAVSAINLSNALAKHGHDVFFLRMNALLRPEPLLDPTVTVIDLKGLSCYWKLTEKYIKDKKGLHKCGLLLLGLVKKLTIRTGLWYKLIFRKVKQYGTFDVALAYRQSEAVYEFVLDKIPADKKIGYIHVTFNHCRDSIRSWGKYLIRFDRVAYVSDAVKKEFIARYPKLEQNACTVYNMIPAEHILSKAKEKAEITADRSVCNIITVSRNANGAKRTNLIPEICASLREKGITNFHWYVAGGGRDLEKNRQYTKELHVDDLVTFCGMLSNPYALLQQCDFSVLLSAEEAFGMVVVESLILHKPIVVTDYPAVFEIIQNGVQGIITSMDKEDILVSVADMICNTENIRTRLTQNIQKYLYDNEKIYQQFMAVVEE